MFESRRWIIYIPCKVFLSSHGLFSVARPYALLSLPRARLLYIETLPRPFHNNKQVLRNRYLSGDMYTSIGPVLIAVNPYKQLEKGGKGIYTAGVADYYHRKVRTPGRCENARASCENPMMVGGV